MISQFIDFIIQLTVGIFKSMWTMYEQLSGMQEQLLSVVTGIPLIIISIILLIPTIIIVGRKLLR